VLVDNIVRDTAAAIVVSAQQQIQERIKERERIEEQKKKEVEAKLKAEKV